MTTTNPTGHEPGHAHEAEVGAAARAIYIQDWDAKNDPSWDAVDRDVRLLYIESATDALAAAMPLIRERLAQEVERKTQYGVQVVWADPVAAGATKPGESYVPDWMVFSTEESADWFAAGYEHYIGCAPEFGGVSEINRATRWAEEAYGEWVLS